MISMLPLISLFINLITYLNFNIESENPKRVQKFINVVINVHFRDESSDPIIYIYIEDMPVDFKIAT